jgi:hypothetical protein
MMNLPYPNNTYNGGPVIVSGTNLSHVWARAFLEVTKPGVTMISPLVATLFNPDGLDIQEDGDIRHALDCELLRTKGFNTETVASTIFPRSFWDPAKAREELYSRYLRVLPQLMKVKKSNRYGLYFARLIAYGPYQINQLEHVIATYKRGVHRRTALQASIFDPARDHTQEARRGFPCLQHVAFAPVAGGGLAVTGFYASQYIFERGYGNYLGLCNLGRFVAHELGLRLTQMNCVAATAKSGDVTKRELAELTAHLRHVLDGAEADGRLLQIAGGGH